MRLDPKLVLSASLAVAIAACARDLEMPSPSSAPQIATFSPAVAYAGEQLTITGSGFDTDPLGNLVQFARASARAEWATSDWIRVRVPADAGDGPFTVMTKGGVSAPTATTFRYLGRGELGAKPVTSERPMLHNPYRVIPVNDETFLHSDLLVGLLRYGDPTFVDDSALSVDQARWTNPPSALWLESAPDPTDANGVAFVSTLVRSTVDVNGNTVRAATSRVSDAGSSGAIVAVRAGGGWGDHVALFRKYVGQGLACGGSWNFYTVELRNLGDLSSLQPETFVAGGGRNGPFVYELRGCVDAGNGDLACLGRDLPYLCGGPLKLLRIRPSLTNGAMDVAFAATTSTPLVENRQVNGDISLQDPLCADAATHVAYVGLADGRLAFAPTNVVTSTTVLSASSTGSRAPARALTCVPPTGPAPATVLVSKHDDDLLVRIDPSGAGSIYWTAPVLKASASGLWCAGACTTGVVHAAGEADNSVLLLDLATGHLLARRTFDLQPGRMHQPFGYFVNRTSSQGAAWFREPGGVPTLAFLVGSPPGVIEWPLSAQRGVGVFPHFRNRSAALVVPWSDAAGYSSVAPQRFSTSSFDGGLDATVQLAADGTDWIHFATSAGMEAFQWSTGAHSAWHTTSPVAEYTSFVYDARMQAILGALTTDGTTWYVQSWAEPQAASAPTATWTAPGFKVAGTARLDGTIWAFYWAHGDDGAEQLRAVALTDALVAVPGTDVVLDDTFYSIIAVSPNGATFVSWERQPFSTDSSVVIRSPDGAGGFVRLATIRVQGQITGAAFDGSGEQLYVVTRGPDQIVLIQ